MRAEFAPETKRLMSEFFKGKICCECGFQAQRLYLSYLKPGEKKQKRETKPPPEDRYYCHDCFTKVTPIELKPKRDFSQKIS